MVNSNVEVVYVNIHTLSTSYISLPPCSSRSCWTTRW